MARVVKSDAELGGDVNLELDVRSGAILNCSEGVENDLLDGNFGSRLEDLEFAMASAVDECFDEPGPV